MVYGPTYKCIATEHDMMKLRGRERLGGRPIPVQREERSSL